MINSKVFLRVKLKKEYGSVTLHGVSIICKLAQNNRRWWPNNFYLLVDNLVDHVDNGSFTWAIWCAMTEPDVSFDMVQANHHSYTPAENCGQRRHFCLSFCT